MYMYMYMYIIYVLNSCIGFPNQQFIINYLFHDISTWDNGTYRSEDIGLKIIHDILILVSD